jgi:hypothetical protein
MKISMDFLAYPNTVKKEHDKIAKQIDDIFTQLFGKAEYFRDCETGRFRKL